MDASTEPATIVLLTSICAIVVLLLVAWPLISNTIKQQRQQSSSSSQRNNINNNSTKYNGVPFLTLHDPDWQALGKTLGAYEAELSVCLEGLSRTLEVCLQSEATLGLSGGLLSEKLRNKIDTLSGLMDENVDVMRNLLDNFPSSKMLAEGPFEESVCDKSNDTAKTNNNNTQPPPPTDPPPRTRLEQPPSSYDSVNQIVAHMVRDWSEEGALVRDSIYGWVQLQVPTANDDDNTQQQWHILIPGAGLGRLAWELAAAGHTVEANEVSLTMASVAHKILNNNHQSSSFAVHPFVTDFFVNEVNSQQRYQAVQVVQPPSKALTNGHLSYTIGDFVQLYGSLQASYYDCVVTCFFLDTATNVMQYLAILSNILPKGGQWINVGPLQWHSNAQLHPSVDELKGLIELFGFRIDKWSVDDKPVDYRLEDPTTVRFTKYEGYQPLRMVATKVKENDKRYPMAVIAESKRVPIRRAATTAQDPPRVTLEHLQQIMTTTTIEELSSDDDE